MTSWAPGGPASSSTATASSPAASWSSMGPATARSTTTSAGPCGSPPSSGSRRSTGSCRGCRSANEASPQTNDSCEGLRLRHHRDRLYLDEQAFAGEGLHADQGAGGQGSVAEGGAPDLAQDGEVRGLVAHHIGVELHHVLGGRPRR